MTELYKGCMFTKTRIGRDAERKYSKKRYRHLTVSLLLCYNKQVGFFRQEGGVLMLYYIASLFISVAVDVALYAIYKRLHRK